MDAQIKKKRFNLSECYKEPSCNIHIFPHQIDRFRYFDWLEIPAHVHRNMYVLQYDTTHDVCLPVRSSEEKKKALKRFAMGIDDAGHRLVRKLSVTLTAGRRATKTRAPTSHLRFAVLRAGARSKVIIL